MSFFPFSSILIIASNLLMAVLVLKFGKDRRLSIIWGIFCVVVSMWGFGGYKFSVAISEESAFLWWQVAFTAVILVPVLFCHFILEYLKLRRPSILVCCYSLAGFFIMTDWCCRAQLLGGVKIMFDQLYWIDPLKQGALLYTVFYAIFYVVILTYSFCLLVVSYAKSSIGKREQLKYFIFGTLLGWFGAESNFLPGFQVPFYPHLNILIAIYPLIITYAITQHHFMDITIAIKKSLVYSTLAAFITAIYSVLVFGVGRLFQGAVGYQSFTLNIFSIFIIAVLFNPLRNQIQKFLDKRFFQGTLETLAQEKQRLQQELFQKEKLAYIGQLASSVAHEIRNPLSAIKTYIDYLPQKYHEEDFKEKFQRLIPKEIERIDKVVEQLLNLAKPRQIQLKPVNISDLIDSTLTLLDDSFALKKITIKRNYTLDEAVISGDEEQLRQVFLNLFLNAIQAMGEGGTLTVGVRVKGLGGSSGLNANPYTRTPKIEITIEDTGCGISPENLKNLFTPFLTTKKDGIGLGLSISQEIVKLHSGTIEVESKVGEGAKFTVELSRI